MLCWVALCVANVIQSLRCRDLGIIYTPPIFMGLSLTSLVAELALAAVLAGFYGLARQRRWRSILVCACIVAATGIASGALQLGSCPHATYLQVAGIDITIRGRACANQQNDNLKPWWMR